MIIDFFKHHLTFLAKLDGVYVIAYGFISKTDVQAIIVVSLKYICIAFLQILGDFVYGWSGV